MRITVFGATGRTGRYILAEGVRRDHQLTASPAGRQPWSARRPAYSPQGNRRCGRGDLHRFRRAVQGPEPRRRGVLVIAHALTGLAGTIGADDLARLARQIEVSGLRPPAEQLTSAMAPVLRALEAEAGMGPG